MSDTATEARPLRYCDVCGGLDDHPRHVTGLPAGADGGVPTREFLDALKPGPVSAVAELISPTTVVRHIDCCAAQGCPICTATEQLTDGARGLDLLEAIQGGALDGFDPNTIGDDHG